MIVVRAIKTGKPFQSSIFRDEAKAEALVIQREMVNDFKKTTKTWQHQPTFGYKVDMGASVGGVRIQVATDDPVYGYIDEGTRVRYATMSGDFQSKTKPKWIGSRAGRGKVLFVNKKRPRPGIKARHFTETIRDKWKSEFARRMKNAVQRFARRSGHGI